MYFTDKMQLVVANLILFLNCRDSAHNQYMEPFPNIMQCSQILCTPRIRDCDQTVGNQHVVPTIVL